MEAKAERTRELSWESGPFAELIRLSWPITISTISYSVMTLVDTLLVGHLGPSQLAGVGLGGTAAFALLYFSVGLLRGVKTLVSQAIGAGRTEQVAPYLGAALLTAIGLGVLNVGVGQALAELLVHLSATEEAGRAARTYLRIRSLGAPMALAYVAMREVRYAEGDARSAMRATVVANLVNIALACLFVFELRLGVAGAAAATVVAHSVEVALMVARPWPHFSRARALSLEHLRELWRIGLPTGLQCMLEVGSFAMLAGMISSLSEVQMAAHQIALQVIQFSFLPAFAVAEAASVLAGQAVGANRDRLVLDVARRAALATGVYTAFFTLLLAGFAPSIVSAFGAEASLAATAVRLLHVAAIFQVFDGVYVVGRSVLRGTGDVRFAAIVGVVTSWALTPPLTWLLGYHFALGAFGGWLGLCCEIVAGAAIVWWRLERRSWTAAAARCRAGMPQVELPGDGMLLVGTGTAASG